MTVKLRPQSSARVMQRGFCGSLGDVHHLRGLDDRQPHEVVQLDGETHPLGQPMDRPLDVQLTVEVTGTRCGHLLVRSAAQS